MAYVPTFLTPIFCEFKREQIRANCFHAFCASRAEFNDNFDCWFSSSHKGFRIWNLCVRDRKFLTVYGNWFDLTFKKPASQCRAIVVFWILIRTFLMSLKAGQFFWQNISNQENCGSAVLFLFRGVFVGLRVLSPLTRLRLMAHTPTNHAKLQIYGQIVLNYDVLLIVLAELCL